MTEAQWALVLAALAAGESADFGVTVNEDDWPAFLLVQWQGLSQPEPIDFPPRGPRVWFI